MAFSFTREKSHRNESTLAVSRENVSLYEILFFLLLRCRERSEPAPGKRSRVRDLSPSSSSALATVPESVRSLIDQFEEFVDKGEPRPSSLLKTLAHTHTLTLTRTQFCSELGDAQPRQIPSSFYPSLLAIAKEATRLHPRVRFDEYQWPSILKH